MSIEPTQKSKAIENLLTMFAGGVSRCETIRSRACMTCEAVEVEFRDALSQRDYAITGMCQDCQDNFYKGCDA